MKNRHTIRHEQSTIVTRVTGAMMPQHLRGLPEVIEFLISPTGD